LIDEKLPHEGTRLVFHAEALLVRYNLSISEQYRKRITEKESEK